MRKPCRPYSRIKGLAAKSNCTITEACKELNIPTGTVHNWGSRPPRALVQYMDLVRYFKTKLRKKNIMTQDLSEGVRRMVERYNFSNSTSQIPAKFFQVLNDNDVVINPLSSPKTKEAAEKIALVWAKKLRAYFGGDFTITVRMDGTLAGLTYYFLADETP